MSPGLDFETRLVVRPNAAALLDAELRNPRYVPQPIAIDTNTDPYQPIERSHEITRACLEVLRRFRRPVAIITKGTLIERDLDILSDMAAQGLVRVGISVTLLDAGLARKLEPRAPSPKRRLVTIGALSGAGVPVRIMASPVIPGLTDHEIEALLAAAREAGADAASWIMLRLPLEVAPLFQGWLQEHYPDRVNRVMNLVREMHGGKDYAADWGRRMRGSGVYARLIARRFEAAAAIAARFWRVVAGAIGRRGKRPKRTGDLIQRRAFATRAGFQRLAHFRQMLGHGTTAAANDRRSCVTRKNRIFGHQVGRAVIMDMPVVVFRDAGVAFRNDRALAALGDKAKHGA